MAEIWHGHATIFGVCGVRKIWRQLVRKGIAVARCMLARLMQAIGLAGVVRGRRVRTTVADPAAVCPLAGSTDSSKPNARMGYGRADFNYVATWSGFVYAAFVINVFARRIVGSRGAQSARATFVFDALEQALLEHRPFGGSGLDCHFGRGPQCVSIRRGRGADAR